MAHFSRIDAIGRVGYARLKGQSYFIAGKLKVFLVALVKPVAYLRDLVT